MHKAIFVFLVALFFGSCTNAQNSDSKNNLSALAFSKAIGDKENVQLIDVRTPREFLKGHIANAVNMNWNANDFEAQTHTLDKAKPVYVYCLSGGRSSAAAENMRKAGFTRVYEMDGGMMEWRSKNLPEAKLLAQETGMSKKQYEALLQTDKLVLIDFYAEWCAPCKKMKPYLDKIASEQADKVTLVRIDADANAALCKKMNVASLPVLKLYRNKEMIWEKTGFTEEKEVREQLK